MLKKKIKCGGIQQIKYGNCGKHLCIPSYNYLVKK